jgi:AcrR family transcriptional regulator
MPRARQRRARVSTSGRDKLVTNWASELPEPDPKTKDPAGKIDLAFGKLETLYPFPWFMNTSAAFSRATRRASPPLAPELRRRILDQARTHFFTYGYSSFTMDDLATELGMSKKTLYVHFRSKETIIRAVLDAFAFEIRSDADRLLADQGLAFAEKLRGFALGLMERLAQFTPAVLRDLQRFAPTLYHHIEHLRGKNIPYIFGRFIEEGQVAGAVRDDISPVFAGEFYLHAVQGIMQPATLQRLGVPPEVALDRALRIFFSGLLTPAGHKEYEKSFPR